MVGYAEHNVCFLLLYRICLSAGGAVLSDAPPGQVVRSAGGQSGVLQHWGRAPADYGFAVLHDCLSSKPASGDDRQEQEKMEKGNPFYRRIFPCGDAGIYEVLCVV